MNCANCKYNDGMVYTSIPVQYRCTITNEYHIGGYNCDVEFAPVRHGRWIDIEPAPHNLFYATCSVCGDRQTIEVANYCPMCGASMDEKSKCVECKGGYCEDECGAKMDEDDKHGGTGGHGGEIKTMRGVTNEARVFWDRHF